jgi:mono/diheme cytochrome c family protein
VRSHSWLILLLLVVLGILAIQPHLPVVQAYTAEQRDAGLQVYTRRCQTCHGDKGQGLTLEWRLTWPETHQNCSTPKCHGTQHPEDGFEIKDNYAPAVIGEGTLARFRTAQDLFTFISTAMPMHAPGSLTEEEYWALTAFLLAAHGVAADDAELNPDTASQIALAESLTAEELTQQAWWRQVTPAPLPVMPGMAQEAPHPTPESTQLPTPSAGGAAGDGWLPPVVGVGLAVVVLALAGAALRQARR